MAPFKFRTFYVILYIAYIFQVQVMVSSHPDGVIYGDGSDRDYRYNNNMTASESGPPTITLPNQCFCSEIYDPVCASNNKSYYNQCQMECDAGNGGVTVISQGNCIIF